MGLFDSVMVPCPSCSTPLEFQSKSGDCSLSRYTLEDAPEEVMRDVNRHAPVWCECGSTVSVDLRRREPILHGTKPLPPHGRIRDQIRSCYVCDKKQKVSEFNLSLDAHKSVGEFGDDEDLYICDADVPDVLKAVQRLKKVK